MPRRHAPSDTAKSKEPTTKCGLLLRKTIIYERRTMTCSGERRRYSWAVMAGEVNATGITPGIPKSDVDT